MCTISVVHDCYDRKIPQIERLPSFADPQNVFLPMPSPVDFTDLRKLIDEFRELVVAAKLIDAKTGQPDCLDPEKAKLEGRVRELESLLASPPEFVIVHGGTVEPGQYRVVDGKLYRLVGGEPA